MSTTDPAPLPPGLAQHIVPLCATPGCAKIRGHADEHGPVTIITSPLVSFELRP